MKKQPENWQEERKGALFIALICLVVGAFLFIRVQIGSNLIEPKDLKSYDNLVIETKPEFHETTGKHSRSWLQFNCVNNRTLFKIESFDYRCADKEEILSEINVNDLVSIKICNDDIDDFNVDTDCSIHSLIKNNKEYLDIDCRNTESNDDSAFGYITLFAVALLNGAFYSPVVKPKFYNDVDPKFIVWVLVIIVFIVLIRK